MNYLQTKLKANGSNVNGSQKSKTFVQTSPLTFIGKTSRNGGENFRKKCIR